jgi:hypothetical protein
MKIIILFLSMFSFSLVTFGQTGVIFNGTTIPTNATPWSWGQSTIEVEQGAGPEGANAIKWVQGDEWGGGWTGIGFTIDPPFDLSAVWETESAVFKLKCEEGVGPLRIQYESNNSAGLKGNVFTPVTDNQWHEYTFPLKDMVLQDATTEFDPSNINVVGIMAEASGIVGKIIYITDWNITTEPSLIIFNGVAYPTTIESWTWGNSVIDIETGAGPVSGSNAVKWVQGDAAGTGIGVTVDPMYDLSTVWQTDSLKFEMKAEQGVDSMTMMFYDGARVIVTQNFVPVTDNQWHDYALPLKDFAPLEGSSTVFDPSTIQFLELNTGLYVGAGTPNKIVYLTNWWTGNPIFDVIPPAAPTSLNSTAEEFKNIITWTDVDGESGERYNLYFSRNPITDAAQADVVELKIAENTQQAEHLLFAPAADQEVSFYYGLTCSDASGNNSPVTSFGPFTNTAKGVATISLNPPLNFAADGDLTEWAGITPLHRVPSDGNQYVVDWGEPFSNDEDLGFDVYMAVDNTYLYVAFDVEDDIVSYQDPSTNYQDSPDFHIGLYNYHGAPHTSYKRIEQPDYLIRFAQSRALIDMITGGDSLLVSGTDYFWGESFPSGYTIEARISWTSLAEKSGDNVFEPVEGYRIPVDIMFNDADATGARESMLHLSPYSNGNSWADPSDWVYTWIGNIWEPVGVEDEGNVIDNYSLSQNYPNPFNPTTQINYSLEKPGLVTIKVYDLLGRVVATLINDQQTSGRHTINFDASTLTSGVYFYQINSGSFSSTKKMILVK